MTLEGEKEKRTDTERLEWLVKHEGLPCQITEFDGMWCVDFSATNGKGWFDYSKDECEATMRDAIDRAMRT